MCRYHKLILTSSQLQVFHQSLRGISQRSAIELSPLFMRFVMYCICLNVLLKASLSRHKQMCRDKDKRDSRTQATENRSSDRAHQNVHRTNELYALFYMLCASSSFDFCEFTAHRMTLTRVRVVTFALSF